MKTVKFITPLLFASALLMGCAQNGQSSEVSSVSDAGSSSIQENSTNPGKNLVVFFSATGSTRRVAGYISNHLNATSFELQPVEAYTSADLNYSNSESRVSKEHNDLNRHVELVSTTVENFASYSNVFIGYPIWWGIAAWPVDDFVKNNDFTGKNVIPFATSASSGLGNSVSLLKEMNNNTGNWLDGQRFSSSATESSVIYWLDGLSL